MKKLYITGAALLMSVFSFAQQKIPKRKQY